MKWKRKLEAGFFKGFMIFSTILLGLVLFLILGSIIVKGLPTISWEMVSQPPGEGFYIGGGGGILNAILGSFLLAFGAIIVAFIVSLPIVLYLNVYRKKNSRLSRFTRFVFDVMWGIPSIIYGAFGFTLMVALGMKVSLLAGILSVGILIIPILSRSMDEVFQQVPSELKAVSLALGATRAETAFRIVLKKGLPGIFTAIVIAFGRAIGDAAAVLFTAGFTDRLPESLDRPVATLPLTIYFQLSSPFPAVQDRAYASALILTVIVLLINLSVRLFHRLLNKNK